MHIHEDHIAGGDHSHHHEHSHIHEHTHDGVAHTHEHCHDHSHSHVHPHEHDHLHGEGHTHDHSHNEEPDGCIGECSICGKCDHTPMAELVALMKYMVGHNAAHTKELADLAIRLEQAGSHAAYEQVMAAVSDYEKGNMRLSVVLNSLDVK